VDGGGVLPSAPETLNQIHPEADRLAHMVDDPQELSRVDIRSVPVSNRAQTTVKRLSPQAIVTQIILYSSLLADLPPVLADEDRITQVLVNLLANGTQYTSEGCAQGHIDEIHISVKDTCIGILPEYPANSFYAFLSHG
jgi:Signal transduction histidine kinase